MQELNQSRSEIDSKSDASDIVEKLLLDVKPERNKDDQGRKDKRNKLDDAINKALLFDIEEE